MRTVHGSSGAAREAWVRRLWPAAGFQFAFICAVVLLKSASNAVVLARFKPQALPYLYVVGAALTAALLSLAGALAARRTGREPRVLAWAGAGVALAVSLALAGGLFSSAMLLYLFAEIFTTSASIVFWNSMSDAFDARESRRAFTVLNGFGMVGGIVGGVLAQSLARHVGAVGLVVMGAALLALAGAFFHFHAPHAEHAAPRAPRHAPKDDVWAFLRSHPYPAALALLVLSFSVITPFADFVFRQRAARMLGEDELAALFGNLQLWMGLFCAAFQIFLAQRLVDRLGLLRFLACIPAALAPFAAFALLSDALWPAYLLKLVEGAASLSILPVAVQLLYAPIPDEIRDRVRALMEGPVKKGGVAVGGILLIGAGSYIAGPLPAVGLVALCGGAGLALWRLRPAYVSALKARLGEAGGEGDAHLRAENHGMLANALRAPEPERVLHALTLLKQGGADLGTHVASLLSHPSERVVEKGVQLAVAEGMTGLAGRIEELIGSAQRRPRFEAVWALASLAPERAAVLLPTLKGDADPGVRSAAIGALVRLQGSTGAEAELAALVESSRTGTVAERRELVKVLGRLRDERWSHALARALTDEDGTVRSLAIRAVGEGGHASLAPRLLPFLTWRDERRTARDALSALGDAVVPLLESALNDRSRPPALRYELPRVLRQIGSQQAFDVLLFSNVRDDAFLHYRIGVALAWLKEKRPELVADLERVREAIGRRRDIYRRLVGPWRDLRAALGEGALLTRAVGDRLDQAFELSFWLLGLLYPPKTLRRIHEHLVGADARRRAYALELMENLLADEDRELVAEQVHAHHRDLPPGAPGRLSDHLGNLCHSDDHVLRACARHVARGRGLWTSPPLEDDMSDATLKRMFALEGVEIFGQHDVDDIAAVAAVAREVHFRAGEHIYEEGDPADALYVVLTGTVYAYRHNERVLTFREREAFGELSLLDGAPRPTTMIADEDTLCLVIDRRDFMDLVSDRPELLRGIFRALSRQLREVVDLAAARRNSADLPPTG